MHISEFLKLSTEERNNLTYLRLTTENITIRGDNLGTIDDDYFKLVCRSIAECKKLQSIDLSCNNDFYFMSAERIEALYSAFGQVPLLDSISLSNNNLGCLDAARIQAFGALKQCLKLRYIDLSVNRLGSLSAVSMEILGKALGQCPALKCITLEGNELCSTIRNLTSHLRQCSLLEKLHLGHNNLNRVDMATWNSLTNDLRSSTTLLDITASEDVSEERKTDLKVIGQRNALFGAILALTMEQVVTDEQNNISSSTNKHSAFKIDRIRSNILAFAFPSASGQLLNRIDNTVKSVLKRRISP